MEQKVFRVWIHETMLFHVDVEAANEQEAKQKVRENIGDDGYEPIEDSYGNTGYEVQEAEEIDRDRADLSN
jgi:DpnD/PcfM-like protein